MSILLAYEFSISFVVAIVVELSFSFQVGCDQYGTAKVQATPNSLKSKTKSLDVSFQRERNPKTKQQQQQKELLLKRNFRSELYD